MVHKLPVAFGPLEARLALTVQQEFGRAVEQQQAEAKVRVIVHARETHGLLDVNNQAFQGFHEEQGCRIVGFADTTAPGSRRAPRRRGRRHAPRPPDRLLEERPRRPGHGPHQRDRPRPRHLAPEPAKDPRGKPIHKHFCLFVRGRLAQRHQQLGHGAPVAEGGVGGGMAGQQPGGLLGARPAQCAQQPDDVPRIAEGGVGGGPPGRARVRCVRVQRVPVPDESDRFAGAALSGSVLGQAGCVTVEAAEHHHRERNSPANFGWNLPPGPGSRCATRWP